MRPGLPAVALALLPALGAAGAAATTELPGVRAPAYPLFAHSPFVSWWSPSVSPTDSTVRHVRNDKDGAMTALVRVDGKAYRLLGRECTPGVPALPMVGLPTVWPLRTVYRFAGAGLSLNLTFAQPKFMEDLHALSLPLGLVWVDVAPSGGGRRPSVQLFFEATAQLAVDDDSQPVVWRRDAWAAGADAGGAASLSVGTEEQAILRQRDLYIDPGQPAEHLEWGYFHLTVPSAAAQHAQTWLGSSNVARGHFARNGSLPAADNLRMPEAVCGSSGQFTFGPAVCTCDDGSVDSTATNWPSLAVAFELGTLSHTPTRSSLLLSVDDLGASARFFGKVLPEYWRRGGMSFDAMLRNASANHAALIAQCERYDRDTVAEFRQAGSDAYATVRDFSRCAPRFSAEVWRGCRWRACRTARPSRTTLCSGTTDKCKAGPRAPQPARSSSSRAWARAGTRRRSTTTWTRSRCLCGGSRSSSTLSSAR